MSSKRKDPVAKSTVKMPPLKPNPNSNYNSVSNKGKANLTRASVSPSLIQKQSQPRKTPQYLSPQKVITQKPNKPKDFSDGVPEGIDLCKEIEDEFGIKVDDQDLDMPWLDHVEELDQRLKQNMKESQSNDTSPLVAFNKAVESVPNEENPFETIKKVKEVGFKAMTDCINKDMDILKQRIEIMNEIRKELMQHSAMDYNADEEPDFEEDFEETPTPKSHSSKITRKP